MKFLRLILLVALIGWNTAAQQSRETSNAQAISSQGTYVITTHDSVPQKDFLPNAEVYTIEHGAEILKVTYSMSQTHSGKQGEFEPTGIHLHFSERDPDLSQIPPLGMKIHACLMTKVFGGEPAIATQPTAAPCMARIGNVLQYRPSWNADVYAYVAFDILSETMTTPSTATRAQSVTPGNDIPAIAKVANGAVVSIIMSDKGSPIAQGSGFLVSKDGVIVTNYHVIAEGSSAVVKLPDGAFFVVDGVLASDRVRDIAVIKAHGNNFRTLTLGNSDHVQVGEEVVAIGNPLSLESTVSNGIVSGIRTDKELGGKFLQITAPISPGSSGGPLFNMAGEVVGITTLYLKGGENLNFAVPVNEAKRILQNQSSRLQNLPNEAEPKATEPKETPNAFIRYHVVAYNPNTNVVVVRYGNRLYTATVVDAVVCHTKPVEEFDSKKDCKSVPSVAGRLVGQDIPGALEEASLGEKFEGYFMLEHSSHLSLGELRKGPNYSPGGPYKGDFHTEAWSIEKVESVQP